MSENSIEFSLSNSEQRDSWLNSGHQTLDADKRNMTHPGKNTQPRGEGYRKGSYGVEEDK